MSERGSAGEGETLGVMVGASIRELGTRDQTQNVNGGLFFSVTRLFCGLRAVLCDPLKRVMLQAKGRSQTTRQTESRNA